MDFKPCHSGKMVFSGFELRFLTWSRFISKDSTFRVVKQLRPDTFSFIDQRFQNRLRVNGVNLNKGSMKLVRISGDFELTEFELCGSK